MGRKMKQVVTGLAVQVEITGYNDFGQVAGRPEKPVVFTVLEADIPEAVMAWVTQKIGMKGSSTTFASCFSTGIARLDAEFRENTRGVLNSANTIRGKQISNVVRRTPVVVMESVTILQA